MFCTDTTFIHNNLFEYFFIFHLYLLSFFRTHINMYISIANMSIAHDQDTWVFAAKFIHHILPLFDIKWDIIGIKSALFYSWIGDVLADMPDLSELFVVVWHHWLGELWQAFE